MDCFALLKQDHQEVAQLLEQCQADGAKKDAQATFKTLARNVAVHTKLEETLFYPRLREQPALSSLIEEAYEEHDAVEQMLEEMAQLSPGDEDWEPTLEELKQNIEHHVKEEEQQLFPKASKVLGKDGAAELGQTMADEKKEMMTGSHGAAKEVFARLGL